VQQGKRDQRKDIKMSKEETDVIESLVFVALYNENLKNIAYGSIKTNGNVTYFLGDISLEKINLYLSKGYELTNEIRIEGFATLVKRTKESR